MPAMLQKILMVLSVLVMAYIVYLAVINWNEVTGLHFGWEAQSSAGDELLTEYSLGSVVLMAFLLTALSVILPVTLWLKQGQKQTIRSQWKKEQAEVETQVAQDRVKVLEAKVKTLETALSESLKRQSRSI